MPTKIIEHKLDKITIEYGYNDNPWTEADEELAQAVVKMYDHQLAMDKKSDAMMTDYFAANRVTDAQREELGKLATLLGDIREEADGFREHFGLAVPPSFIDFAFRVSEAGRAVKEFDAPFREHCSRMDVLCDVLNAFTEESEEDYVFWDEYVDVKNRHSDDYENNSIDITKFDFAEEKLEAVESVHGRTRSDNRERCREYHDDHRCFVLEVTVEYEVWDEFLKRFMLLAYIFGEKTMLPGVWEN